MSEMSGTGVDEVKLTKNQKKIKKKKKEEEDMAFGRAMSLAGRWRRTSILVG